MKMMDTTVIGCVLFSTCAVCGTILACKSRELKLKYGKSIRTEKAYKNLQKEADNWRLLYEKEKTHAEDLETKIKVKDYIMSRTKVKDLAVHD